MTQVNLTMAPNGRVVIPAHMRAELGWQSGAKLVARLVDGTVILEPVDAAIDRWPVRPGALPLDPAKG
jgi:AbrB family looped-hinge helix DNA binding protein